MSTGGSQPWLKSASQLSLGGSSAVFENGIFDWSNSFFEIKKRRQDEEGLISKCEERKKILESVKSRKDELHKEMAQLKEQHLSHNVFLKSKDTDQMLKKAEAE
ncbi:hypothetical protein WMY93_021118 [Mugilogobius chulae]|uniref:Uncharacterized protein n=1 Tax=Mugilogobius chulae TaxID=88201 RepID=A0AAW0N9T1_9GOBI